MTGEIPAELGTLTNLTKLSLSNNQLSGVVPQALVGLTMLDLFYFYNNPDLCAPVDAAFQTWLQEIPTVRGSSCAPADSLEDRAVLVKLHGATGGDGWENSANWLSDRPVREWHGVVSDASGRVTGLFLHENQLSGTIPSELGNLSSLEWLSLWGNELTGEIPPELGDLTNLEELRLTRNLLTGEIPPELARLAGLEILGLGGNQLTGTIPTWLGSLTDLEELYLWGNQLTGEIPAELGHLTNLTVLYLSGNQLTGCVPEGLRDVMDNDFAQLGLNLLHTCGPAGCPVRRQRQRDHREERGHSGHQRLPEWRGRHYQVRCNTSGPTLSEWLGRSMQRDSTSETFGPELSGVCLRRSMARPALCRR